MQNILGVVTRKLRTGSEKARIVVQEDGAIAGILSVCAEGLATMGVHALDRFRWSAATSRWDSDFDARLAVKTSKIRNVPDLDLDPAAAANANRYEATTRLEFRMVMSMIDLDPRDYLFIDYGSGMGRAMLMAAQYPFAMIRGIEASAHLHEIAVRNVAAFLPGSPACRDVVPVLMDARAAVPEHAPFLAFFYNSFAGDTLRAVLGNLARAATSHRPCYLVYLNPTCRKLVDETGDFSLVRQGFGGYILLYRITPSRA